MKILIFGASGMVGQGVLRECLVDARVTSVVAVGRTPLAAKHAKLGELIHRDFTDFSALAGAFADIDACFFCLGVSSVGMAEDAYTRITHDFTLAAARAMPTDRPLTFTYVTGAGTGERDAMWSRVKGRTENELLAMPFHAYMFRPAYIQPLHGVASSTRAVRWSYAAVSWAYPLLQRLTPNYVTTTENVGRAMLAVTRWGGAGKRILNSPDINRAAANPAVPL